MNCDDIRQVLDAYVDGELGAERCLEFEAHQAGCPHCTGALQMRRALHEAVAGQASYYRAPRALRERIAAQLGEPERRVRRSWIPWAVAAAAVMAVSVLGTWKLLTRGDALAGEIVSSHVRSLMAEHLTDVRSSDQHTVKPWFAGKVDFAPETPDLARRGFPLAGGRLDYIGGRPVAAVVYRRGQHVINVFLWPAAGAGTQPRAQQVRGFNLVRWTHGGLSYSAVSDLNGRELQELAALLRGGY